MNLSKNKTTFNIHYMLIILINILISLMIKSFSYFAFSALITLVIIVLFKNKNNKIIKILLISTIVNLLFMLFLYYLYQFSYGIPYYIGGSDDLNFEIWAKDIFNRNIFTYSKLNEIDDYRYNNSKGYILYLSYIIRFGSYFDGFHTMIPRMLNVYFLVIGNYLLYSTFLKDKKISNEKKHIIIILSSVLPNVMYITTHNFRDPILYLLIILVMNLFSNILRKFDLKKVITIILLGYIIYTIRQQFLLVVIFTLVVLLFLRERETFSLKSLLPIAIVFTLLTMFYKDEIFRFLGYYDFSETENSGFSSFVFSITIFPFNYIVRFLYSLIYPIPFINVSSLANSTNVGLSIIDLFIKFGSIINFILIPYFFINIFKRKNIKELLLYFVILSPIIFITFTFRHFLFIYPWYFIISISNINKNNKNIIPIMMMLYILLSIGYNLM